MTPARTYPERRDGVRLLVVDPDTATLASARISDLPDLLAPGDLLVVNDAATLPASLRGHNADGHAVEVRLLARIGDSVFRAALFGAGDWRQRTEDRPPPPALAVGDVLRFGTLAAHIAAVTPGSARLVDLAFHVEAAALWAALYREARPIQYSYLAHELPLWAVQTVYAARPWAFEMPSAGRPLSWEILLALRRRGVDWASVTHAAGLSATGDAALDAALPMAERFEIPPATVDAVAAAHDRGGRVIAVGTTVVRALEGAVECWGELRAGVGETALRVGPGYRPRLVDGVFTGVHAPDERHFALLGAFAAPPLLDAAVARAERDGYRTHEFGDAMMVVPGALRARRRPCARPSTPARARGLESGCAPP